MDINHISVSRHGIWNECQEKYKFQYHLKVPPPGPEPIYFSYGKTVHKIAELLVKNAGEHWNEIVHDVINGKIEIQEGQYAPKLDKEYSKKIINHLKNLYDFTMKIGFDYVGHTEYKFEYDLMPPNQYFITGFIDRIFIKNEKYFILDYKTTKKGPWRKNKVSVLSDLQLRTYANVIHREFGAKPENIECYLYYLEGGDLIGATYNKQSLEEAEKELLDVYLQIKETKPEDAVGRVGDHCRRCPFASMCKWRSLTDE